MNTLPLEIAGALTLTEARQDVEYCLNRQQNPPRRIDPGSSQAERIARYRLEKAIGDLAAATDGDRHGLLISKACYLFGMVKGGWPLTDSEVVSRLMSAMHTNGALSKYGEREVERCINDARSMADPRPVEIQERQEQPYDTPAIDLDRAPADSPSEWFSDVPDSWRELAMNVLKPIHALIFELLFAAAKAGLINPHDFTAPDLQAANEALGFHIPQTTLRRGIDELSGEFFPLFPIIESALNTLVGNFGNNSTRGRKATRYGLNSRAVVQSKLLEYANPRIYERASQTHDGDVLLPPTAGMVEAIGVGEGAATIAAELHTALTPAYQAQGNREQAAVKRATKKRARLIQDLDNPYSTQLVTDYLPLNSATNYRAVYVRSKVKVDPDAQRSNNEVAEMTGLDRRSVKALRARAGIHAESQETHVEVKSFDELRTYGKDKRAYAKSVTARTADGQTVTPDLQESYPAFIARQRSLGATVTAHFQHTSTYKIVREAPPAPAERKPREHMAGMVSRSTERTNEPKPERYYGRGYDPRWVMRQLKLGLKLLGWQAIGGRYVNPDTGEFAPDEPHQIVETIIGREDNEDWTGFLADAVELGAVSRIEARTMRPPGEGWQEVPLRRIA